MICPPNLWALERRFKKGIALEILIEIPHYVIQKTVNHSKANQVLTKDKTGVPGGILWGQGSLVALETTATALALFFALFSKDITLLIQT